jgi:hypothetical protein
MCERQSAMSQVATRDIEAMVLSSSGYDPLVQRVWSDVVARLPALTLRGAGRLVFAALLVALAIMFRPAARAQDCLRFDDLAQTLRDAQLRRADELIRQSQQRCYDNVGRLVATVSQLLDFGK